MSLFFVFILGTCIGSFLNVCIYRIPLKQDIVKLPSHCMSCGRQLKWYELIPVVSFVVQGGKCRECKEKLSVQYPIVEAAVGLLYLYVFCLYGLSVKTVIMCLMMSVLLVIAVIDFRTFEIPLGCNIFLFLLGIVNLIYDRKNAVAYATGFFAVSGLLFIIWLVSKGRAIGGGDIKLLAAAGLLLGWKSIIVAFLIACISGAVIHLLRMKLAGADRRLAFGPYLSAGIAIAAIYGDMLADMYIHYLIG